VRVYVPVGVEDLAVLVAEGRLVGPLRAHAVTDELRAQWPEADDDSWEYAALMAAGAASRPSPAGRRRVVAADVSQVESPGVDDRGDDDPTAVRLPGDVTWKGVAAAHVDTVDGADEDDDLAWFATQEIAHLLDTP
jgi:hypothetical protein